MPKYYNASAGTFVEISQEFLTQVRNIPASARAEAMRWAQRAGREQAKHGEELEAARQEYLAEDAESLMGRDSAEDLAEFAAFRAAFQGIDAPEVSVFFEGTEALLDTHLEQRRQAKFRSNSNTFAAKNARVAGLNLERQTLSFAPIFAQSLTR